MMFYEPLRKRRRGECSRGDITFRSKNEKGKLSVCQSSPFRLLIDKEMFVKTPFVLFLERRSRQLPCLLANRKGKTVFVSQSIGDESICHSAGVY